MLCIFTSFRYWPKYLAQIYSAQYGYEATMLVYLQFTPTSQQANGVNILNLL